MQRLMFPLRDDNPPSTGPVAATAIIVLFFPDGDLNNSPRRKG